MCDTYQIDDVTDGCKEQNVRSIQNFPWVLFPEGRSPSRPCHHLLPTRLSSTKSKSNRAGSRGAAEDCLQICPFLIRRFDLQVFLLAVLAVTYYLVDYVTDLRQEQVEKSREQAERAARARQVAKERWQRAGRKIITVIRKQNKLQGLAAPRPVSRRECSITTRLQRVCMSKND
jgi:hypothetical protein